MRFESLFSNITRNVVRKNAANVGVLDCCAKKKKKKKKGKRKKEKKKKEKKEKKRKEKEKKKKKRLQQSMLTVENTLLKMNCKQEPTSAVENE